MFENYVERCNMNEVGEIMSTYGRLKVISLLQFADWKASIIGDGGISQNMAAMREYPMLDDAFNPAQYAGSRAEFKYYPQCLGFSTGSNIALPAIKNFRSFRELLFLCHTGYDIVACLSLWFAYSLLLDVLTMKQSPACTLTLSVQQSAAKSNGIRFVLLTFFATREQPLLSHHREPD